MNALEKAQKYAAASQTGEAQAYALVAIAEQLRVMNLRAALDVAATQEEQDRLFDDIMRTLYPPQMEQPQKPTPEKLRFPDMEDAHEA